MRFTTKKSIYLSSRRYKHMIGDEEEREEKENKK